MIVINREDPRARDITALLQVHLDFMNQHSAPEDVHALDVDALCSPDVDFFAARNETDLLGVGALRWLDAQHVELKSMHTSAAARGQGIGRAMVEHLVASAQAKGATQVSLETGTMEAMAPARALYQALGFTPCEPFGDYWVTDASICMTRQLE